MVDKNSRRKACSMFHEFYLVTLCIYLIRRLHWQSPFHWTDSFMCSSLIRYSQTVKTERHNDLREDTLSWATKLLSKEITLKDVKEERNCTRAQRFCLAWGLWWATKDIHLRLQKSKAVKIISNTSDSKKDFVSGYDIPGALCFIAI
jgi:hypothetical protein